MGKFSDLTENEQKDYDFAYRQLDTIDSKAGNILLVGSILIVISTLSLLFSGEANVYTRIVGTLAVVLTLISIALCSVSFEIIWSDSFSIDELKRVRDDRTTKLYYSVITLLSALILFVLMFVVDLAPTYVWNASK